MMPKFRPTSIVLFCLLVAILNSCDNSKARPKPDVSHIPVDIHLLRFDRDMRGFAGNDFSLQDSLMRAKYGQFYDFFVRHFLMAQDPSIRDSAEAIKKYIADGYVKRVQDSIDFYFKDTRDVEQDLTQAFKYANYYFPEIKAPQAIAVNSGFSIGAFSYGKDVLGIGLDMYFGPRNPDYDSAGIYEYVHPKMRREFISRNAMDVIYDLYFGVDITAPNKTLIEAMIDRGKKIYFLSYVLPDAPDSVLVGFTSKQTKWCEDNEYEMWKYMNEKDLLYKNNYMDKKRYLDEGPNTPGMPPESPGNVGTWIGLQMVRKFMKETGGKISLRDMILKYDSKAILQKAKYRPSKSVF